jgi:flagellar hook-associated protein 1 FlgK
MPISTFTGLQTALSGLQAYQDAIDTTGQNIANANTPGYSRQTVNLTESDALDVPVMSTVSGTGGQLGTGVDVSSVSRIRDQFLDIQYRAQNATSGAATQASTDLTAAQSAVTSGSISTQLQSFWTAWGAVASNPSGTGSSAAVQALVGNATSLAQSFNSVSSQLSTITSDDAQQIQSLTGADGQVQNDVNQIATLNGQIAQQTSAGQTPNDLLDQRDLALDDLSGFGALSVTNGSNGMVNVAFSQVSTATPPTTALSPIQLVSGTTPTDLSTPAGASILTGPQLAQISGELGTLYNDYASPTGPILTLSASLDNVASQLISSVNNLLAPSNGLAPPSSQFFSGTSASTIAVAPATTSASIQTWLSGTSGTTSGAAVASLIAGLQGGAADQADSTFVAQVGDAVQSAQTTSTNASSLLSSINNQRESVSGVSLDEEMTNLINYQQAYQASARVMTTIDTVLSTLIGIGSGVS